MTVSLSRRALVAGAAALLLLGGGAAMAATSSEACAPPADPSSATQLQAWQECRFDRLDAKLDALATPAPTVTVTQTATATTTVTTTTTVTAPPTSSTTSQPATTTTEPTTSTTSTPPTGWPGPGNTGVPDGTTLTAYTGPMTVTADGTVIDAKIITGDLEIAAKDVRITRSMFVNGSVQDRKTEGSSFTIEDSTIQAGNRQQRGLWGDHLTARRLDISGGYSGGWCNYCTVEDSWVHSQFYESGWHVSAFRMDHYTTLRHNTLSCDLPVYPDGGCSADMTGYGDFHVVEHNTIDQNLFVGNAGASYCAYGGSTEGKPYSDGTNNVVFTDNVFQRGITGKCGRYGPIASFDPNAPGNLWSGNTWDDGSALPAPGQ
jgi:hypothetical protein